MAVSGKHNARRGGRSFVFHTVLCAMLAATLEGAKLALSAIPNVEVVSLLCALYGSLFGWLGLCAVYLFVFIEPLIWGVGSWVISYFIYWPALCLIFIFLSRRSLGRVAQRAVPTLTVALMTVAFGFLTSFVDLLFYSGSFENFFSRFAIYYARGAVFYATQLVCNVILFIFVYVPLRNRLSLLAKTCLKYN